MSRMRTRDLLAALSLMTAVACKDAKPSPEPEKRASDKVTAQECRTAYEHLADLKAKADTSITREQFLELQRGNLESCPKMATRASLDCMLAMTSYDMMAWSACDARR
jgi:hypothetical protein